MNDKEIMKMVEERLAELEEVRLDLAYLRNKDPEIFEKYEQLTEIYNHKFDAIKNLLKELSTPDAVRIGSFSRDRKSTSLKYKPSLLPNEVLVIPGVVKDVDAKKITELVALGVIEQHQLETASYEYSRSPSVRTGDVQRANLPTLAAAK